MHHARHAVGWALAVLALLAAAWLLTVALLRLTLGPALAVLAALLTEAAA